MATIHFLITETLRLAGANRVLRVAPAIERLATAQRECERTPRGVGASARIACVRAVIAAAKETS